MTKCIVILFPAKLRDFDIEVTLCPTSKKPGTARILNAIVGPQRPDAPNSLPLISCSEEYIGFIAEAKLVEPPFIHCYEIEEEN